MLVNAGASLISPDERRSFALFAGLRQRAAPAGRRREEETQARRHGQDTAFMYTGNVTANMATFKIVVLMMVAVGLAPGDQAVAVMPRVSCQCCFWFSYLFQDVCMS